MSSWKIVALTFVMSLVYGLSTLISADTFIDNWISAGFAAYCFGLFLVLARSIGTTSESGIESSPHFNVRFLIALSASLHLGIILSFWLMDAPNDRLWVFDSYNLHIPSAKNIADALAGVAPVRELENSFDRIYLSQIFVGIFFYLFGATPVASGLALLCAKLATIKVLYRFAVSLANERSALCAVAAYVLLPTITFYTTVFYKEAFIHLFIVSAMFLNLVIFRHGINKFRGILALILLLAIGNERFYLAPLFFISLCWVVIAHYRPRISVLVSLFACLLVGATGFIWHFSDQINFRNLVGELARFKGEYNAFSDVDKKWNAELPYPLGVIKLYFSPYFHPRKFELFENFSLLINWGSFMSQMVLLGGGWEILRRFRKEKLHFVTTNGFLIFPLIGFLAVFGYVAPFAGRLRDAFVPLLAIYFALAFLRAANSFSIKFKKSKAI